MMVEPLDDVLMHYVLILSLQILLNIIYNYVTFRRGPQSTMKPEKN
jgi:hypothetical protein